jgi:hypothetical protein
MMRFSGLGRRNPATSLEPARVAILLRPGQGKRTMRESEIQEKLRSAHRQEKEGRVDRAQETTLALTRRRFPLK